MKKYIAEVGNDFEHFSGKSIIEAKKHAQFWKRYLNLKGYLKIRLIKKS